MGGGGGGSVNCIHYIVNNVWGTILGWGQYSRVLIKKENKAVAANVEQPCLLIRVMSREPAAKR